MKRNAKLFVLSLAVRISGVIRLIASNFVSYDFNYGFATAGGIMAIIGFVSSFVFAIRKDK